MYNLMSIQVDTMKILIKLLRLSLLDKNYEDKRLAAAACEVFLTENILYEQRK